MDGIIAVITTSDDPEVLERIGASLLEARLISCIQVVGPIKSTYWWKGAIRKSEEWMGVMKSRRELYPRVEEEIRHSHPYETPQIEAFHVTDVLSAYGKWVIDETRLPSVLDTKCP
jgi:periplasmic divalent cation tolerance protein